jgi:hypothetical protein
MPEDAIIRIDSEAAAKRVEDAERVPVFEVDGTVYTVAKVTRADIALEYLGRVEEDGPDEAQAWMIRTTVGDEGFQALRGVKGLEPEHWEAIQDRIRGIVSPKARGTRG